MTRAWKILKWTVIGLTGAFLALVLFLVLWIDPNDYRDDVTRLVQEQTGLVLKIEGNIGWNFYPAIGFSVSEMSLATAADTAPLATVGKAAVSVELLPLFRREINVRTLYVDRLAAYLVVDAEGKGNWEALSAGGEQQPAPDSTPPADLPRISLPQVVITNSLFDYETRGEAPSRYTLTLREFVAEDFSMEREFPVRIAALADDHKGLRADFTARAFVLMDLPAQAYGVRALEFNGDIAGILEQPFTVKIGANVVANMQQQKITVSELAVEAANLALGGRPQPATLRGQLVLDLAADSAAVGPLLFSLGNVNGSLDVKASDISKEELAYAGTLDVVPFNAKHLMREMGIEVPKTADAATLTQVGVKTAFNGGKRQAALENLDIRVDDTHIRGRVAVTDIALKALAFNLDIDAMNLDRYLPPASTTPAPAPAPGAKPEPLLPVPLLRMLDVDGRLTAGKLTVMEWPATKLQLGIKAKHGDVQLDPIAATVLDGTVTGTVRIDARPDLPVITTNLKLDKVEVGGIVKRYTGRDLFLGKTSATLAVNATGNDVDTLLRQAVGSLDLSFIDATLRGTNLTNLLNETLTQQLGAFAMLVPDYQQRLPKEMHQDTVFNTLAGGLKLENGVATIPAFNAGVRDGAVKGSGSFNLLTMDFDYNMAMRTDKLKDSKYFANAEFPVRCKGNISGAPPDWCRPDTRAIGDMLKKAAESAAKDRVKSELAKQLGVESVNTEELRQEVKQEVEQKKEEVEQKAKERANKELERALKKYF